MAKVSPSTRGSATTAAATSAAAKTGAARAGALADAPGHVPVGVVPADEAVIQSALVRAAATPVARPRSGGSEAASLPSSASSASVRSSTTPGARVPTATTDDGQNSPTRTRAPLEPGAIPASLAIGEAEGVGPTGRPRPEFPTPAPLDRHGPARILAMCNQKGGVGKTTSTINLGAALAEAGRRVLLVDLDPQGALSVGLGVNPLQLDRTVYNLLMESDIRVEDVMLKTDVAGLDLLPSNIDLSAAEVQLVNEVAREQSLARVLAPVLDDYDVVLIDCQPSLGLLTVNALTAAHGVIIPLECEFFALRGVALLIQTIEKIRERLNPQLELEGILATMYDSRTLHGREVLARVVEAFGDKVFHTVINRTIRFPETTVAGEPITTYASSSAGATAYRELAKEVLAR
ncbi:MAG: Cobyrinic acid a,c-diamide synthase [Frankiales bacterium]|nr:Cobyrinic acid a,c-diamide synthase [Frankiales bacterium]